VLTNFLINTTVTKLSSTTTTSKLRLRRNTMKFTSPAIVALATAPAAVQAWNMGQSHSLASMLLQMSPVSVMLDRQRSLSQRMFDQTGISSPRYELVDDEDKFKLSVDVPGVKKEDIDIQLEDGFLTVKGHREASTDSSHFSSRFSQTFSLDRNVDVDQFTATLSNGVLTIAAPKDIKKLEESIRRIPIAAGEPSVPTLEATEEQQKIDIQEGGSEAKGKEFKEEPQEIDLDAMES
jgi:HSP20 family protein